MDLAKDLRAAQETADRLAAELADARTRVDGAARAYDARRRYAPAGAETVAARTAWGLALYEWCRMLTEHAAAVDRVAVERRRVDRDVADELLLPTGGPR